MIAAMRRVRTLAVKEFLVLLRDPRGRSTLVVPPIIQLLLFAYAVTLEVNNVSVIFLNQDLGRHGHEITERVAASPYFSSIAFTDRPQGLGLALERQEALLAIQLPQDFSRTIEAGTGASLQVLSDGRRSNAVQIVTAYLTEIVNQYSLELAGEPAGAVQAEGRHWFNPDLVYVWTIIPSLMAIITLIMTLNLSAMSLAREKELGTFEQLLVSPFSPAEIIIGKLIPAMILAVFESMLIFLLGRLLYGVPMRGSFLLLLASIVIFSFSVIGFGFFTSSIVKTQQQAIVGAFMFMVPSVALSGFAAPVENMPAWLQKAVILNPLKHALVILKGIFLKDMPAGEVWLNAWPLVAIGVVSLAFSGWLFRRNLG
ncbi:MAG: ABC transporter permease [Deltaproteobacteria bacterium]|jgi:ABC-2 type transport system permease protein|nr:ABC transporter permease [Deltaproteobacteria bacterium]